MALTVDGNDPSLDASTYAQAGKVGLGDLDIAPDEKTLWTVSLNDKRLVRIPIASPSTATSYAIPAPTGAFACASGTHRPFALEFYRDKLYIGMVCDASASTAANLKAVVMTMSWASPGTFTQVFKLR